MASFASSATMCGARKHAWTKKKEEEILQGLGVGPGSATERWPSRKIARKLPFFLGGEKIT